MIYALAFHLDGIIGPAGFVHRSRGEVLSYARSLAEAALDHLGDYVGESEWFDCTGEEADPYELIRTTDENELESAISQVNDQLLAKDMGYLGLSAYDDLGEFIEAQNVLEWCSDAAKQKLRQVRASEDAFIDVIAAEWSRV